MDYCPTCDQPQRIVDTSPEDTYTGIYLACGHTLDYRGKD